MRLLPAYRPPSSPLVDQALNEAEEVTFTQITVWDLVSVDPKKVIKTEYKPPSQELIQLMKRTPARVPPIVVELTFGGYGIVDGHRRLEAAIQASLKRIWAVAVGAVGWPRYETPLELASRRSVRYH